MSRGPGAVSPRNRLAIAGARATTAAMLRDQPRGDVIRNAVFAALLLLAVLIALAGLLALLIQAFVEGAPALSADLFTNPPSTIFPEKAGFRPAIIGSLELIAGVIVFVVPVGIGAAIYLEEYADNTRWWNRLIEVNIQNLAAVPSIIYGILGLAFIVRGPLDLGFILVAGSLTLALLVLPMVIIAGREALRAVPSSIREGSMALGATQWQTIWRQVLPAAVPGIATGVILALSRAIGETAPLIVVGAATVVAFNPSGLDSDFTAMPIQIFDWISRASNNINDYRPLAAAGILLLMILLLAMNSVAIWLRNRYEQKW